MEKYVKPAFEEENIIIDDCILASLSLSNNALKGYSLYNEEL